MNAFAAAAALSVVPAKDLLAKIAKYEPHPGHHMPDHRLAITLLPATAAAFALANGLPADAAASIRVYVEPHTDPATGDAGVLLRLATLHTPSQHARALTRLTADAVGVKFDGPALHQLQLREGLGSFGTGEVVAKLTSTKALFIPFVPLDKRRAPRQLHTHRRTQGDAGTVLKAITSRVAPAPADDPTAGSYSERLNTALAAAKSNGCRLTVSPSGSFTFTPID